MRSDGRSLELYFINGKPDGMLTATVPFNWTGHVLMTSRNQLSDALKREETLRSGVYILLGEDEDGSIAYIGETEEIRQRIKSHAKNKDWWTSAILITDTGNELNKAHVKYLESRLVEIAYDAQKVRLENGNIPPRSSLSEAAISNMESFLANILLVLPAIRVDCFIKETLPKSSSSTDGVSNEDKTHFEIIAFKGQVRATAILEDEHFVVLKGSKARKKWVGKMGGQYGDGYSHLFYELINKGILVPEGDTNVFTESYAFKSASASAAVVLGRTSAGPIEWKVAGTKKTYKEYEAEQLGEDVE